MAKKGRRCGDTDAAEMIIAEETEEQDFAVVVIDDRLAKMMWSIWI